MKEKILAQLVTKFPGVSKKFLGLWAEKLLPKVTEETEIQGIVDELDNLPVSITDLAAEFQKEGDRRATEAVNKKPKEDPKPKEETKTDDDETPKWAKALFEKVERLEKEKVTQSARAKFEDKLKEKKIPLSFAKQFSIESEDQLDNVLAEVEKSFTEFKQELNDQGLSIPIPGAPAGTPSATALDNEIKSWAKSKEVQSEEK